MPTDLKMFKVISPQIDVTAFFKNLKIGMPQDSVITY